MKKLLTSLGIVAVSFCGFAQGTMWFTTLSSANGVNAKVYLDGVTPLAGNGYLAQLYAAQDAGASYYALRPGTPVTTFRTGEGAGYVNPTTVTFSHIPPDYAGYTVQMRVWDNRSGFYPDWTSAEIAWTTGLIFAGLSTPMSFTGKIGGVQTSPTFLTGLQSFSLIPEPSALALGGLGFISFLIYRRRKS